MSEDKEYVGDSYAGRSDEHAKIEKVKSSRRGRCPS